MHITPNMQTDFIVLPQPVIQKLDLFITLRIESNILLDDVQNVVLLAKYKLTKFLYIFWKFLVVLFKFALLLKNLIQYSEENITNRYLLLQWRQFDDIIQRLQGVSKQLSIKMNRIVTLLLILTGLQRIFVKILKN